MRLAVDATALLDARTGVGVFLAELLDRLAPGGAGEDDLAVVAYGVTWRGRGRLARLVPGGIHVARRPMAAQPLRQCWRRADWPPIEWWTGPVDVVHGPNFVVPPARRAAMLATVHDLTPVRFPELCTRDTLQYPGLLRRALARGAHVHAVSAFVAAEVVELLGARPERVHVVAHGVLPTAGGDPAVGRRLAGGHRYVLALGTVEPRKNLPLLVGAFDRLAGHDPEVRLVVAGPDGWGAADLSAAIAASAHRDRIVRLGFVSDEHRAALLAGAAVFAYPSRYEGFGFPPLEAMAAGTPVVATSAGALPEVVGDAALLVPTGDTEELAGALALVLDDDALARSLRAKGHDRVQRYSWDACATAMRALYARLAAERS